MTKRPLWQGASSCMKIGSPVPEFPDKPCMLAGALIQLRNQMLFQFRFALLLVHIALNNVQMASTKHGHDTPHCDLLCIRNKCKLITYTFVIFFIPFLEFFAQLCRLAFISCISFCFLRGRQACIPTVNRHHRTVRALTLKPRCDSFVQCRLLVFFLSLLHSITKIESFQAIFHICLFSLL